MSDFFISYTSADLGWAEWISWILEEAGFSVTNQAWDFGPGGNFVLAMQQATTEAARVLAVLSQDYLASRFAAPEWAAAFAGDPDGLKRCLVPVRVGQCRLDGLWKAIVYIDLVGIDEPTAAKRLLDGIRGQRRKPHERPKFPGLLRTAVHDRPPFPGFRGITVAREATPRIPKLHGSHTDIEKRRFLRGAFNEIADYFETALAAVPIRLRGVECEFDRESASQFVAEIFLQGKSRCRCKIWIDNQLGGGIAYYEGQDRAGGKALNDILTVSEYEGDLVLAAQMGFAFGRANDALELDHLAPTCAAEYFWDRFVSHLE